MADIRVQTPAIQQAGSNFASHAVQLADLISQVQRDIEGLSGLWTGPAASQFTSLMSDWHKNSTGIQTDLDSVSQKLKQSSTGYDDLEQQITRSFQGY